MNEKSCGKCLCSRTVVSENGYFSCCALSQKDATECLTNDKKYYTAPLDKNSPEYKEMYRSVALGLSAELCDMAGRRMV